VSIVWPITIDDVRAARDRIRPFLPVTPFRNYGTLDEAVGGGTRVFVKHENFQPTNSFKIRNGVSFMSALGADARARGVVAATRGNHGLGISWAGAQFGVRVTICVPVGNNPEKNAAMRALGARLIEEGRDYDESLEVAERVVRTEGAAMAHSTNDRNVVAGASTMSLEMIEQEPELDALVIAVGGGSQAVGALTVARACAPRVGVYAVQAEGAAAAFESWKAGTMVGLPSANTFADGLATRSAYELTFGTLCDGLAGQRVGIVISGGNIDEATLRRIVAREL
jgi:threonine dehydratase